ncbi:MaoC family dehydratase [Desulfoscipio gibsoniae]|uniref:Acyl dehydratase n=1 Tax=Desulfoscipio gibsoniae DSM 7213 TaxID=767817 RepID=R4KIA4_9FIRM|nr:MaoC family dehydratase [Desulfoscipio gibsoniae]AGL02933.1 acyl dehydratase [Desulfoscipio gibsoniae DSM 7213]
MQGKTINEIQIGDKAYFSKTISESDIYMYAGITGDFSEIHVNQQEAEKTIFKGRIAHGMLTAGYISTVIGTKLPGSGTIYLQQQINFLKPVKIQDTIRAEIKVLEIFPEKNRVKLKTCCFNQRNELVLDGEALVMPPKTS